MDDTWRDRALRSLNILAKWRSLLAGWQLGTRSDTDPEARAVRDHREATLLLRAESNAAVGLLIEKGVISEEEWWRALDRAARDQSEALSERFPGVAATEDGLSIKPDVAQEWMRRENWKP